MEENGKKEESESNHDPVMAERILPAGLGRRQEGPCALGSWDWKAFYGAGWEAGYVSRRVSHSS